MNEKRSMIWFSRLVVGTVFILNISCAVLFIVRPQVYMGSFELSGVAGENMVRGFGILFLMWNVTYPLVILNPLKNQVVYVLVLTQQLIGVVGEVALFAWLPFGHSNLRTTGLRFIYFDGIGLVWMVAAYILLRRKSQDDVKSSS